MINVLFFNHKINNCGVYQYGKRVIDILHKNIEINYIYKEIDCIEEYNTIINEHNNIKAIIYNYHGSTMSWLNFSNIQKIIKNIGIPHESPEHLFDIICNIDPNAPESYNRFSLPRPIYENVDELISISSLYNDPTINDDIQNFINKYTDTNIPIFGSFGFGFDNKGFDKIIKYVNEQYNSAIIKFVIPIAHFDPEPNRVYRLKHLCMNIPIKPGIKIMINHNFFSTNDILKFLSFNTMNIFLYDTMHGRGISSTIDYALSVKKPFAISDSYMFRNIYSDEICLYKNSIDYCLHNSLKYSLFYLNKYSNSTLIQKINNIIINL
jgi:hypothetical protein